MKLPRSILFSLLTLLGLACFGAAVLLGGYLYVARTLPKVDTLADYRPPIITRVLSDDGGTIAEYARERRIVVPVAKMPKQLIQAFVAAEDSNFFQHQGIDLISILRAAMKNVLAGGIVQGGSTITQQVAKSLLLTPEKKFSRKFKEAILAWRMEKTLSKEDILFLYLNQIYLGHGAYGVAAAAETYFDKTIDQLSLAECSLLAGLPQAPSRYSPYQNFPRAKERQKYVLGRMVAEGYIAPLQAQMAESQELVIRSHGNDHGNLAAYFSEQVRRYLEGTYGADTLYSEGLEVRTSMNLALQEAAQNAVRDNLRNLDKRRGYRGPKQVFSEAEEAAFLAAQRSDLARSPLVSGRVLEGVLSGTHGPALEVRIGDRRGEIPLTDCQWAGTVRLAPRGMRAHGNLDGGDSRLPVGSLLEVKILEVPAQGPLKLALEQEPEAEGALVAIDPQNGQVKAMVGGYDFARSQFNRVIQARRLPGSAIKPIIYAAALDKGYTPATVILDTPVIYKDRSPSGEEIEWKPKNYGGKFGGPMTFREALTHSANVVTIKVLEDIGVGYVINYARKLGIESPLPRDLTLALGSAAVTPMELATAYTVFASGGVRLTPSYITSIRDRDGRILESTDPADFPGGPGPGQRLIRLSAERVISPETAYLITNLMESVVQNGTGQLAKSLGRPAAGKTGTTNDLKDAWFAGFFPQLVAVTWVGFDQERPLGSKETGARAALPAWVAFMDAVAKRYPPREFPVPDSIEFRPIDAATGLLVPEENPQAVIEAFAPGTAPTRTALEALKLKARDFFRMDLETP